jgi:hypothetical protein
MMEAFAWLVILTVWVSLLWIGGVIGEWMLHRNKKDPGGNPEG